MLTALTPVSNKVLQRFASTLGPYSAVPQLNSIYCAVHIRRSAVRHTLTRSDTTVNVRWPYTLLSTFLEFCPLIYSALATRY